MADQQILKTYYYHLFPYDTFIEWLEYKHEVKDTSLKNREFSFTLENDVYIRHLTFTDKETFEQAMLQYIPFKIDIGAEYDIIPNTLNSKKDILPIHKEICIDIDITDYDDVRTCCKKSDICQKCWKYMNLACRILESIFQEELGFKHTLWVFSGRRGIHCWICDPLARSFDALERSSLTTFLKSLKQKKFKNKTLPPMYRRIMEIIDSSFIEICITDQQLLGKTENVESFVGKMPDRNIRSKFQEEMMKYDTSEERWNAFVSLYEHLEKTNGIKENMRGYVEYIKVQWTFPRLDVEVTKSFNHLLKSPYCVHPKTGKVCVPFSPKLGDKFNPDDVPTIDMLVDQIGQYNAQMDPTLPDFRKTSLKNARKTDLLKSLRVFEEFVAKLKREGNEKSFKRTY